MTTRVRYCIECPKCRTRYLVAFSPYGNGSYVISTVDGSFEEYTLYCSCGSPASQWNWSEMKPCEVSKAAYRRGYGSDEEILQLGNRRGKPGRSTWFPVSA